VSEVAGQELVFVSFFFLEANGAVFFLEAMAEEMR